MVGVREETTPTLSATVVVAATKIFLNAVTTKGNLGLHTTWVITPNCLHPLTNNAYRRQACNGFETNALASSITILEKKIHLQILSAQRIAPLRALLQVFDTLLLFQ